jgi:hypothetical protein
MARFVQVQTNFSTGELDPLLRARIDLEAYQNALEEATNVVVQPQGGIRRRPGTRYITALPNSGADSAGNGVRLVPFEFSTSDSYMLCFSHNRMYVFKNGALVTGINGGANPYLSTSSVGLTGARLATVNWTQSADTLIMCHQDIQPVKIVRGANDASWTVSALAFESIPRYAFAITTTNPAGTLTPSSITGTKINLTSSANVFTSAMVGQFINASPQGRAKIVAFVSSSVVQAVTEFPFFDTTAIAQGNWQLESGYENVWSSTRGWPRSVTFHEGRLYFGGSRSRPSTVWGSKIGLFFSFAATEGLDDDAVEATLDTNTFNAIIDITSGRDLQLFTSGGEFYVPQEGLEPITPANFFVKASTRNGAKEGIRVQQLESGTLFVQRQGKSLSEFAFTDSQLTYVTSKISLLAGHLLRNPTRMALRRSVATDENDLLFITNGQDGTMAVFSLLRSQNVIAPSEFSTDGEFVDVGVDITTIYSVVKRVVDGATVYYVERFDDTLQTDSAVTGGVASTAALPHLVGKPVDIILDGMIQPIETVPAGGTVTFDRASTSSFQAGLDYTVRAVTMPTEVRLQSGSRIGFRKRIVEVNALVKDTQHLKINGTNVPFRALDNPNTLDEPIQEFTGTKTLQGILGYTQDGKITIEQDIPLKMTLLGLEYKVSVYQGT